MGCGQNHTAEGEVILSLLRATGVFLDGNGVSIGLPTAIDKDSPVTWSVLILCLLLVLYAQTTTTGIIISMIGLIY